MREWGFLTNHARVLLCIAEGRDSRLREIADCVGMKERAIAGIVNDLCEAGYLTKRKVGRRNLYQINAALPLRGTLEADRTVGDLLSPLVERASGGNEEAA